MQRTILLADDDAAVRRMLCRVLSEENYRVIPVQSREEALRKLKEESIDLMLLDLGLTNMTGQQFLKEFRGENSATPLILISAHRGKTPLVLNEGIVLEKPLDLLKLLTLIQKLLHEAIEA